MYELIQVGKNSYYMDCPAKVGFYRISENEVVLIDSGSDKDAGKKVKRILDEQGWTLKAIFNTHFHADHTGGNQYLQNQTGCKVYAYGIDLAVTEHTVLEPTMLYGAFPMKEMKNKFLMAKESVVEKLTADVLPSGMEMIELPGHSFDMVGFRTDDNVVFLADCLASEDTLEKYQICFLYDVQSYLETLEMVKTLEADCFVPAHVSPVQDIAPLAQKNIDKTQDVIEKLKTLLEEPKSFEQLLSQVFSEYGLDMNLQQRMLIGSTVKSYLSYLKDLGEIEYFFENNMMIWRKL